MGIETRSHHRAPPPGSSPAQERRHVAEQHGTWHVPPEEAAQDLAVRLRPGGGRFWLAVLLLAALAAAGVVALAALALTRPAATAGWGYTAATLAFLLSAAQAAPVLGFFTRLVRGYWAMPLRRAADLFAVAGLVTVPLFLVLVAQLPSYQGRPSIWFGWPGAPGVWDAAAVALLGLVGLLLLYVSSLPDLAVARDVRAGGVASRLALGWRGGARQWRVLRAGVLLLGLLYTLLLAFVHLLVASDLAVSMVPGWRSGLLPVYHLVSGLQAGVAAAVLALAVLCWRGGLRPYVSVDPFWNAAKLLLTFSLLFFWLSWSEFLTYWYGRTPPERWLLGLLMFGPYLGWFLLSLALNFLVPFLVLLWHPFRVSVRGPAIVAALVLVGNLVDRLRIYVAAWSVAELRGPGGEPDLLPAPRPGRPDWLPDLAPLPATQWPEALDLLVVVGAPAAVALLYLLALRLLPALSVWEYKADRLLRFQRPYIRTQVAVAAKPE